MTSGGHRGCGQLRGPLGGIEINGASLARRLRTDFERLDAPQDEFSPRLLDAQGDPVRINLSRIERIPIEGGFFHRRQGLACEEAAGLLLPDVC